MVYNKLKVNNKTFVYDREKGEVVELKSGSREGAGSTQPLTVRPAKRIKTGSVRNRSGSPGVNIKDWVFSGKQAGSHSSQE